MRKLLLALLVCFAFLAGNAQTITGSTSFCQGGAATLTVTGAPGGSTFQWQRSTDGGATWNNITGATSISYSANIPASYTVIITTAGIPTTLPAVVITENPNPVPDFTLTNNNSCAGTTIQFTSSVLNGTAPYLYAWDFGDLTTSTAQDPTHVFTSLGCGTATFAVVLRVTDANGCLNTVTKTITVKQIPDVQVKDLTHPFSEFNNCGSSPSVSNPNFFVTIGNISPDAACISSYIVDWGDGLVQNLPPLNFPLSHTYSQLGTFNLQVTAVGNNGCSNTKTYVVVNQANPAVGISGPGGTSGCAPSGFWFKLTQFQLNSPGTFYVWNFGDGSPTITWNAPITVDSIFHTFAATSCTVAGSQFTVKVTAKNGCDSTAATVNNIKIFKKPVANFSVPVSACVSVPVVFTNLTIESYNAGNCNRATDYDWNFGDGSPNSTVPNPSHIFTATGNYTVRLIATGLCGNDTISKVICIVNPPTSSFTIDNNTGCTPLNVAGTNTSNTLTNCIAAVYLWTVTYAATNCGNSPLWTFTNGTNASSVNPSFTFTNPGTYTITLRVTNACGVVTSSTNVIVKKPPTVNLAVIANQCTPATINPIATVTNCGTTTLSYSWSFPGGSPATATTLNPGPVIYNAAGTYTVTLTVTNECGAATVTQQFTVRDQPATPIAGSNSPLCSGATLNLTSTAGPAGATYAWTGPGGYTSALQNPIRTGVTVAMSGNYTVTVNLNGCASLPATTNVIINQSPAVPVVTTPVNYCLGATAVALTATGTTGNTFLWYTTPTGGTGTPAAPIPSTASAGTITYYVSQVNASGTCESARAAIVVNVFAIAVINGSSTNPTTCTSNNGMITITGLAPNTSYNIQYIKNGGTPVTIPLVSNSSGTVTILNLSAGTYSGITATLNGCVSNIIGPFMLVDPSPPASTTAGSNGPLCSGATLNLTSTAAPAGAVYSWTGPGGFTSTLQNPVRANVTTAMSGIYSVTVTLNGCISLPATVAVLINQTPALPTGTSAVNYCQGATAIPLTATAAAGNSLLWYAVATGGTGLATAPTPSTVAVGTTTYYVSQASSAGPCESGRAPIAVNIHPIPAIAGSSTNPTTCASTNGTMTITGLGVNTSYNVQYTRNGAPVTVVLPSNGSGVLTIPNLAAGTYTNIFVTLNGCASNSLGPIILVNPAGPATPVAAANSPLCSAATLNLTSSSGAAGTTYSWTGPAGFTSALQNPVITNTTAAMSGLYTLITNLNGCSSTAVTVSVVINQTPSLPVVTTPVNLCQGAVSSPLSAINSPGYNLLWYVAASGGTGITTAPAPSTASVGTVTYYVSQLNPAGNCESGRVPIVVNVNPIPVITGSSTNPTACSLSDGTIRLTGLVPNTFYSVQYTSNGGLPATFNFTSNGAGAIIITNLSTGTYTNISVSPTGCQSNIVGPFSLIAPLAPATPVIISNSPLCTGGTLNLTATNVPPGTTYIWSGPAGFSSSLPNPIRTNVTTAMSGAYNLVITVNNCSSPGASSNITIGDNPVVSLGPDLTLVYGTQHTLNPTIQNGPITSYLWTQALNLSCTNCPAPVADIRGNISYTLKVTNIFGCSASDTIKLNVICNNSNVFIPNAFSPDKDGVNDVLMVRAAAPVVIKYFRIFNKWGELVFEKSNFLPNTSSGAWDGTIKGKIGPSDVYVYTVEVKCDNGSNYIYKGNVTLLQ